MSKYKKIAIMFALSYVVALLVLLVEFFIELVVEDTVNFLLLMPILAGTFTFLIANAVLKPHIDFNE